MLSYFPRFSLEKSAFRSFIEIHSLTFKYFIHSTISFIILLSVSIILFRPKIVGFYRCRTSTFIEDRWKANSIKKTLSNKLFDRTRRKVYQKIFGHLDRSFSSTWSTRRSMDRTRRMENDATRSSTCSSSISPRIDSNSCMKTWTALDKMTFHTEITWCFNIGTVQGFALIAGLLLEGAAWDREKKNLVEQLTWQYRQSMPLMKFFRIESSRYHRENHLSMPVYVTSDRRHSMGQVFHQWSSFTNE